MHKLNILMVDDHPMIIEGYQNTLLSTKTDDQDLAIDIASTCDMANEMMLASVKHQNPYDILFVDIKLPPSKDGAITSGEDLAKVAREILPDAKIIILTMFNESYRIHNILKTINPDGFLIKSDLTSNELAKAFQTILTNPPYYSSTVNGFLRQSITSDVYVDDKNRKILHLLSQGVKTKNLAEHLNLSLSAVEKRKKQLKELFKIQDGQDESLINEAREKGFL
ncbi:MAG: response regulator transcription factor [Flavobacteriaceae bacterium]|nr:response regulator [Bacteroidia bacterium]NND09897.1 response regulator transcription factor [Flavobacteriaceae bacterium]NNL60570.1 response regulator transcription factor [Flavobacteriaceae bacterium]RZV56261.1 MAG: response regulator transcription factor [Flavobacteriaceae bacterium]